MMLNSKGYTRNILAFLVLSSLVFSLMACSDNPAPNTLKSESIPVTVMKVSKGNIEVFTQYSGVIQPKKLAYVITAIPGRVKNAYFDIGNRVKKGDLLFTVDSAEIEDNIRLLEEQLKVAETNISLAETGVIAASSSQYESQKLQLETALKSAESNFTAAKEALDKATLLKEAGILNSLEYTNIRNNFNQAENALNSAYKAYELYETKISKNADSAAKDQLAQAKNAYDIIKLQKEIALEKLSYTKVTAPMDGVIATKDIVSGCLISNAMIPYTIMDADTVQLVISVTEQVINKIQKGHKLNIHIPSVGIDAYTGVVDTVSPAVDPKTMTYKVLVDIENINQEIKPGMTAKAGILTEKLTEVILIPASALIRKDGETYVYTIKDKLAVMKSVNIGSNDGNQVEIIEGLGIGELLVVKGQQFLSQSAQVTISEEVSK